MFGGPQVEDGDSTKRQKSGAVQLLVLNRCYVRLDEHVSPGLGASVLNLYGVASGRSRPIPRETMGGRHDIVPGKVDLRREHGGSVEQGPHEQTCRTRPGALGFEMNRNAPRYSSALRERHCAIRNVDVGRR